VSCGSFEVQQDSSGGYAPSPGIPLPNRCPLSLTQTSLAMKSAQSKAPQAALLFQHPEYGLDDRLPWGGAEGTNIVGSGHQ